MKGSEYAKRFAEKIVEALDKGTAPWQRTWEPGCDGMPRNALTGARYNGQNLFWLMMAEFDEEYDDSRWATFRQWRELGANVRKGQKGSPVIVFKKFWMKKDPETGEEVKVVPKVPFSRIFHVFNSAQVDGAPEEEGPEDRPWMSADWDHAESILQSGRVPEIRFNQSRAYYSLRQDYIGMPERERFAEGGEYYRTAFHEAAHATGHESRLDRQTLQKGVDAGFGSKAYAYEELVVEMASMMISRELGIGFDPRHGHNYLAHWREVLSEPGAIQKASAESQSIASWLAAG